LAQIYVCSIFRAMETVTINIQYDLDTLVTINTHVDLDTMDTITITNTHHDLDTLVASTFEQYNYNVTDYHDSNNSDIYGMDTSIYAKTNTLAPSRRWWW